MKTIASWTFCFFIILYDTKIIDFKELLKSIPHLPFPSSTELEQQINLEVCFAQNAYSPN
jgi:hypothetical protein